MRTRTTRDAAMPLMSTGVLMAAYLLLRPYGDSTGDLAAADAMASNWWLVSHVCGMLALASLARAALRLADVVGGVRARLARWAGLGGLILVLPYYGMEAFALHVVARAALAGDGPALSLLADIRAQPVAMTMFGIGLVLLAVSGVAMASAWQNSGSAPARAGWPLAVLVALLLPHFYLPQGGRMAYGVAYLLAAVAFATAVWRSEPSDTDPGVLSEVGVRISA